MLKFIINRSFINRALSKVTPLTTAAVLLALMLLTAAHVQAQTCCEPSYRLVYKTVYDQQPVTTYKLQYETVMRPREVTTLKPVWTTEKRQKTYRVAKPVMETSVRQETYKVYKPIWTTKYEERSYNRVRYVTETQNRQERIVVNKPVWSTETRQQRQIVRKQVAETVMQDRQYTTFEPITTCRTQMVDRGGYATQNVCVPGAVSNRLRWLQPGVVNDAATGVSYYRRGGLHWVPQQAASRVVAQRVYVPNMVAQQIKETRMQPKVVTQKVPVTVNRCVEEVVLKPYQVQVCKMQQEVQVRNTPIKVCKPVTERITYKVPIRTCNMQEQVMVRKIPVTTCRWEYETKVEPYEVRVCRLQREVKVVNDPCTVATWKKEVQMCQKPRTVVMRVPTSTCSVAGGCDTCASTTFHSGAFDASPAGMDCSSGVCVPAAATSALKPGTFDCTSGVCVPVDAASEKPDGASQESKKEPTPAATAGESVLKSATGGQPAADDAAMAPGKDAEDAAEEAQPPAAPAEKPSDADPTGKPSLKSGARGVLRPVPPAELSPPANGGYGDKDI